MTDPTSDEWLDRYYELVSTPSVGYGFRSANGRSVIEVKHDVRGLRELHAALVQLALVVGRDPTIEHAHLVVGASRINLQRLGEEWAQFSRVLKPDVARRLAVIAIAGNTTWSAPDHPALVPLARWALNRLGRDRERVAHADAPDLPSRKAFEIWKVLLERWLRRGAALSVGELMRLSGCSYPTVASALRRLDARHELRRHSSRSVELRVFPRTTFGEVLVLSESLRRPVWFIDRSGHPTDTQGLLRRLRSKRPSGIALGGVVAAQHFDPAFDLHGVPRVDLILHASDGHYDLDFVERLDPALHRSSSADGAALAVHPLVRAHDLFEAAPDGGLPFADPVETLLDLHELRLHDQADAFVQTLRGEASR